MIDPETSLAWGANTESVVDRSNKNIDFLFGGRELHMDFDNTKVFTYPERYQAFNHIYHEYDDGEGTRRFVMLFDCQECMDDLHEADYPTLSLPFPSEIVEASFFEAEAKFFNDELKHIDEVD